MGSRRRAGFRSDETGSRRDVHPMPPGCADAASALRYACLTFCAGRSMCSFAHLGEEGASVKIADLEAWKREIGPRSKCQLRVVAITAANGLPDPEGVASLDDRKGGFAAAYGPPDLTFLIRPDGHVGWRGWSSREPSLLSYLDMILQPDHAAVS